MCDYSLYTVKTRPAKVGDELTVRNFGTGTHGFSAPEDKNVAVCLLPGTELSFAEEFDEKVFGRGVTSLSGIEPQFFGKSTRTDLQPITTRLNSQMVRLFF